MAAEICDFLYGFFDIVYSDNHRRILSWPIGFFWEKATVDGAGIFWAVIAGFGCGC
jgi:hypothetical protein